ncbi:phosphotransferase [Streptomyces sp. NPDC001514]
MAAEPVSATRRRAAEFCGDEALLVGPLHGYHHETYVLPLHSDAGRTLRVKCREPRAGLLWFDRRCFASEDELVRALQGRISSLPGIHPAGDVSLQRFIEGETLGEVYGERGEVPSDIVRQLMELVRELAAIRIKDLALDRRCEPADRPEDGDTRGFLERLIRFVEVRVHGAHLAEYGELFAELGVTADSLNRLRERVAGPTSRPFCLLHGDLHRENFILDHRGGLWTIDWELAMFGDPLYDLATHLHLMGYPDEQAAAVARAWAEAVEEVLPGGSAGWEEDLDRLLAFKRAQSVFTDVIRGALTLAAGAELDWPQLERTAERLNGVLALAAEPLALADVPSAGRIRDALLAWYKQSRP